MVEFSVTGVPAFHDGIVIIPDPQFAGEFPVVPFASVQVT
jgi:hypothetical protein